MPREMSLEAREKLSRIAKDRHRRGELGVSQLDGKRGTNKRKDRITKRVAEAAIEDNNARAIIEVFRDAIHPNQPMSIRLKGAEVWARIAAEHHKTEVAEQAQEGVERSREELIEILRGKLKTGPTANIIMGQIEAESIADAEVIDAEDQDVDPDSDSAAA